MSSRTNSKDSQHLGNTKELCWFAMEMAEQLELHKDEKESLREWGFGDVRTLVITNLKKRIKILEDIESSKEDLEKQAIHIGNYAMMLFLRSKYNV